MAINPLETVCNGNVLTADALSERSSVLPALFLAFYAALVPFDNILWLTKEWGTFTKYLAILTALSVLADRIVVGRGRIVRPHPAYRWWLIFAVIAILSSFWSVNQDATIMGLPTLIGLITVFFIVLIQPWNMEHLKIIEAGILIGGLVIAAIGIYMYFGAIYYPQTVRLSLVSGQRLIDPNHFAASLILPLSIALNRLLEKKSRLFLSAVPFSLMLLALILTGSRGGLVGFSVAAIYLFWKGKRSIRLILVLVLASVLGVFILPQLFTPALQQRYTLQDIITTQAAGRFPLWKSAIDAFWKRPLSGWGYDSFSTLTGGTIAYLHRQVVHNIYLQALSELGVFGFAVLLFGLIAGYRVASRYALEDNFYRGVVAALLGIMVISFSLGTLNYKYFWLVQMLAFIVPCSNVCKSVKTVSTQGEFRGKSRSCC